MYERSIKEGDDHQWLEVLVVRVSCYLLYVPYRCFVSVNNIRLDPDPLSRNRNRFDQIP
jgi:hypothetical protein